VAANSRISMQLIMLFGKFFNSTFIVTENYVQSNSVSERTSERQEFSRFVNNKSVNINGIIVLTAHGRHIEHLV